MKLWLAALFGLFFVSMALSHEGANGIVLERMKAMSAMEKHMKAIGSQLLGKEPFNPVDVLRQVEALHKYCHNMGEMFPAGSSSPHSYAKAAVWEQPKAFHEEMTRLHQASERLVAAASGGDKIQTLAAFRQTAATCKSCHELFRAPGD